MPIQAVKRKNANTVKEIATYVKNKWKWAWLEKEVVVDR